MRSSRRFSMAVHILVFVAAHPTGTQVTSRMLADSIDTNAVLVRNVFQSLTEAGLLCASAGKGGGVRLIRPAADISLWDIYRAVECTDAEEVFHLCEGNSLCPVGQNIRGILLPHAQDAMDAMRGAWESVSVEDLLSELAAVTDRAGEEERA